MSNVSIRDLRNHGGEIVARAQHGEHIVITSSGTPVAELRPLAARPLSLDALIDRRRNLPLVDPVKLRAEIDALVDQRMW